MTTLENRPNTALLVVDVQNGVVEGAQERDAVVANVGSLVDKARREQVAVVWVQHSDEQLVRGSGTGGSCKATLIVSPSSPFACTERYPRSKNHKRTQDQLTDKPCREESSSGPRTDP